MNRVESFKGYFKEAGVKVEGDMVRVTDKAGNDTWHDIKSGDAGTMARQVLTAIKVKDLEGAK